ncbi:uncharacterized protein A4U43_C04F4980 [Asparagus officinalis]|uniref:Uncharacterized protein n=1 Tax=Asparagus officinalis TaxID=4686 RepID=A0A5P1EYF6_ASPOF|nr:uncharacterized protein A4U43_C04F4980 [Asparagus officinalis]
MQDYGDVDGSNVWRVKGEAAAQGGSLEAYDDGDNETLNIHGIKLFSVFRTSILCQSDSVEASDCSVDEIVQKNSSNSSVRNQNDSRDNAGDAEVDGISVRCQNNSRDDIRAAPMDDLNSEKSIPSLQVLFVCIN